MSTDVTQNPYQFEEQGQHGLTLTQIPLTHPAITNRVTDFSDADSLHKAVMSLYPANLPGERPLRRNSAAVLFRLETRGTPHVLSQSVISPMPDPLLRSTDLMRWLHPLEEGRHLILKLRYNAVTTRRGKRAAIPRENLQAHMKQRLAWLHDLAIHEAAPYSPLHLAGVPIRAVDFTIEGKLTDKRGFLNDAIRGVGKARSFGCGMLMVYPQ